MQHDAVAVTIVVQIEHRIDVGLINTTCHFMEVLIGEHVAWLVFVITCHLQRFLGKGNTHLRTHQRVGQRILAIELSEEQVTGSNGLLEGLAPRSRVASGQLHAVAVIAVRVIRTGIFSGSSIRTSNVISLVARCPDIVARAIRHLVPHVVLLLVVQFKMFEVVFVAGMSHLAELHLIGAVPLAVLRSHGIGDGTFREVLHGAVSGRDGCAGSEVEVYSYLR